MRIDNYNMVIADNVERIKSLPIEERIVELIDYVDNVENLDILTMRANFLLEMRAIHIANTPRTSNEEVIKGAIASYNKGAISDKEKSRLESLAVKAKAKLEN